MRKWATNYLPDANISLARRASQHQTIFVNPINTCGGCGQAAQVYVNGYPRCQPCANKVVELWNQMRSNKNGQDS